MRPYEIAMMSERTMTTMVRWPDVYEVKKSRWHWITWLRTWLMRNVAGESKKPEYTVTRKLIEPDKVMEKIHAHIGEHFFHGRTPGAILMGTEDYAKLMNELAEKSMFTVDAEYMRGNCRHAEVFGLRVTVIPWMRGVLVTPEGVLIDNRRL